MEDYSLHRITVEEPEDMVKLFFEELQIALGPSSPGRKWSASHVLAAWKHTSNIETGDINTSISECGGLVNLAKRKA